MKIITNYYAEDDFFLTVTINSEILTSIINNRVKNVVLPDV